ncbi:VOC family protein [Halobacillus sp. Marseille-P3879]|uniref:VOC family protein n=1 Tax=Halobacillus sp. Marseille-P3879 TaxID=2045014 RepID=UPI001F466357|nr:VOC family protein [Halobacillus sp. Marseille-P3879]
MNPISKQVGAIFIPVKDIEKARDWYCDLLGEAAEGEIPFGHLYILPMESPRIVLDSKIYAADAVYKVPSFHFNTKNIQAAYQFMKSKNVELMTEIQHGHWFTFKDPDGNLLMVAEC